MFTNVKGVFAVSIRAPARGATSDNRCSGCGSGFQFALPRGERLAGNFVGECIANVSIRAPARGATTKPQPFSIWLGFQFALPRGERP